MVQELKRIAGWRARLDAELNRQRRLPFGWGGQDCALGLAARAVEAITGADLAADWRGKYASGASAAEALAAAGYASLGDAVAAVLPEQPNLLAARAGDIGLVRAEGEIGEALCVIDVSSLIVLTARGHGRAPRSDLIRAYTVG